MNRIKETLIRLPDENGQTVVEFALTLMTTLLLIFGFIDFSRAVYASSVIQAAAQEGARAGIIDLANVEDAVMSKLVALDATKVEILPVTVTPDDTVTVAVEYTFEFIVPIISDIVGQQLVLRSSASMLRQ